MQSVKYNLLLLSVCFIFFACERRYSGGVNNNERDQNIALPVNKGNQAESDKNKNFNKPNDNDKTNRSIESPKVSELFKKLEKSVFMVFATDNYGSGSQGSGFLLNENIGITNFHVIDRNVDNYYILSNGNFYPIEAFYDYSETEKLDYIVFKINGFKGVPLKVSNKRPEIGDDVFAIGSPKGLNNSLTKGTISGFRKNSRIQIDATIDHGSSGGPLFNLWGEVIGITSGGIEGSALNFAIDIQEIPYIKYSK